jgi:hypothetical protein
MNGITIVSIIVLLFVNACGISFAENDQGDEHPKIIQKWQKVPIIPNEWVEIDRIATKITKENYDDVFSIITDGKNDLIVWFEKDKNVWKMVILSTVPTEKHLSYGVKTKDLKLFVKDGCLLYGIEGSEAISIFKWNPKGRTFLEYIPPYM